MATALGLSGGAAQAVPNEVTTTQTAEPRVLLRIIGSDQALTLLASTADELFRRLGVQVDVLPISDDLPDEDPPPIAIATIEITPPLCSIVIIDGETGAELDRRSFTESSVETAVEAAAHIAYFVVETRLEADERPGQPEPQSPSAGTDVEPAPATAPAPVVPVPPEARGAPEAGASDSGNANANTNGNANSVGIDLGLTFSITSLGSGRVRPGSGLTGELRFPNLGVQLGVLVAATTHAASDLEFQGATAEIRPSVLRVLTTLDLPLGSALAVSFGAGGGLEWLRLTPTASSEGVQVSGAESVFEGLVTGVAGLRIQLGERAFLSALGGIDVSLNPSSFTAHTEAGDEELLQMPRVRPMMLVGAAASLDQSPRFGSARAP